MSCYQTFTTPIGSQRPSPVSCLLSPLSSRQRRSSTAVQHFSNLRHVLVLTSNNFSEINHISCSFSPQDDPHSHSHSHSHSNPALTFTTILGLQRNPQCLSAKFSRNIIPPSSILPRSLARLATCARPDPSSSRSA